MADSVTSSLPARRRANAPFERTARWLLAAATIFILYVSLFPFAFDTEPGGSLFALIASLQFQRTSRGDIVANLLLYVPFGLCLASAWPRRGPATARLLLAVTAGAALSLTVELLQTMEPLRVASLTDLALNVAGTAIGTLAAIAYVAVGTQIRIPGLVESRPAPVPLGFMLLWLSYRLAPFVPVFRWERIEESLRPVLIEPAIDAFEALRFLVGWLVIAHAVRRIWRKEYALLVLVALAAGSQLGRVFIVDKTVNPSELVGLAALFLLLPLMNRQPTARRLLILCLALTTIIVLQGLEPWHIDTTRRAFSWVPFLNSVSDLLQVNINVLLEKFFWYASLVWLLAQRSGALGLVGLGVAALVGGIECLQMWMPGRSAEITDPLLVLAAAGLIHLLDPKTQSSARLGSIVL